MKTTKRTVGGKRTKVINRADQIVMENRYNLEPKHQEWIKDHHLDYNDLLKLTQDCFDDPSLTEDADEHDNIRKYIIRVKKGVECYNFTEKELEYLADNASKQYPMSLVRDLFPGKDGNLAKEAQSAAEVIKAWGLELESEDNKESLTGPYVPPKNEHLILAKINKADINANYHLAKLDVKKKNSIAALKRNLHMARFVATASSIKTKTLREMFESEFIRATYDKPDLNSEEVNGYVSLCNDYVLSVMILEQIATLNDRLAEAADDEQGRTFTKNLSDSLSTKTNEFHQTNMRIVKMQTDLSGTRNKRMQLSNEANDSLSSFVNLCMEAEGREKLLRMQAARNLEIGQEIDKLASFDDMIANIFGVSREEIINF